MSSCVPKLQFDSLPAAIYCFDLEVDPKGGREGGVEGALLGEAEEDAGLAHPGVPDQKELEEQVIVLGLIHHLSPKMCHFSYLSSYLVVSGVISQRRSSNSLVAFFVVVPFLYFDVWRNTAVSFWANQTKPKSFNFYIESTD